MIVSQHTISKLLQAELPGTRSLCKMLPPERILEAATDKRIKNSSVLLLLFQEKDELMACLIKRSSLMKHHAGQIALPGGRMEQGETAMETALRETFEEIGVPKERIQILGQLSKFYVEVSQFDIQPIVGWLNEKPNVVLCCDEVEKIVFFPIRNFKPPHEEMELDTITGKLKVPCIKFEGEVIWGATAMILSEFYDVLKQTQENSII